MEESILGPEISGPNFWYQIHRMTFMITDLKRFEAYWYFTHRVVPEIFPCDICRKHLKENLKKVPALEPTEPLSETALAWSNKLNNVVNVMLKKPEYPLDSAKNLYSAHDPVRSFITAWYIIHSATSKVGSDSYKKKLYSRLVGIIVPALMLTGEMRDSYMRLLRAKPLPESGLLEWSIRLRNEHAQACGYPPINLDAAIKRFGTECHKCKIK